MLSKSEINCANNYIWTKFEQFATKVDLYATCCRTLFSIRATFSVQIFNRIVTHSLSIWQTRSKNMNNCKTFATTEASQCMIEFNWNNFVFTIVSSISDFDYYKDVTLQTILWPVFVVCWRCIFRRLSAAIIRRFSGKNFDGKVQHVYIYTDGLPEKRLMMVAESGRNI